MKHFLWGCTIFLVVSMILIPVAFWALLQGSFLVCVVGLGILFIAWYAVYILMIQEHLKNEKLNSENKD